MDYYCHSINVFFKRVIMFIPKIRTKVGGKIAGKLLDPKTKRAFNGKFVKDFKGNFFKGERINSKSEPLLFVPNDQAIEELTGLRQIYVKPSPEDYTNGFFVRYFVKDAPTKKVFEVDKESYVREKKAKKNYRKALKLKWSIKGPVEDTIVKGYLYPGTASHNQDVINKAEVEMPGIAKQQLKNPRQFVK